MYQTTGKLITVNNKNVQRVGVGAVFHVILHHHVENLIPHSDSLCEISHITEKIFPQLL